MIDYKDWNIHYIGYTTSEDCLYLDVFGPADVSEKLPVFVWIHGGSFMGDWNPDWTAQKLTFILF